LRQIVFPVTFGELCAGLFDRSWAFGRLAIEGSPWRRAAAPSHEKTALGRARESW
jgi:hypothetical protein